MLLGCCHCGPIDQSEYPSDSNASVLKPEEICGACYNFPARWAVTFNNDWFVWAGDLEEDYIECPQASGDFEYILRRVESGSGVCAVWESTERAINFSANSCDPDELEFETCGPWQPTARVQLTAQRLTDDSTLFTLSFKWAFCRGVNPADAWISGFTWRWRVFRTATGNLKSCVRIFEANYHEPFSSDPFAGSGPPYGLSTTNTGWESILVQPAV